MISRSDQRGSFLFLAAALTALVSDEPGRLLANHLYYELCEFFAKIVNLHRSRSRCAGPCILVATQSGLLLPFRPTLAPQMRNRIRQREYQPLLKGLPCLKHANDGSN